MLAPAPEELPARASARPGARATQAQSSATARPRQKARDRNSLFEAGIKDQLIKEGKLKVHQNVIDRLIASYRG